MESHSPQFMSYIRQMKGSAKNIENKILFASSLDQWLFSNDCFNPSWFQVIFHGFRSSSFLSSHLLCFQAIFYGIRSSFTVSGHPPWFQIIFNGFRWSWVKTRTVRRCHLPNHPAQSWGNPSKNKRVQKSESYNIHLSKESSQVHCNCCAYNYLKWVYYPENFPKWFAHHS